MAARPIVSVIIPSFDGREFLAECLPGLRAQSLPREQFETIVVDNGSTDGTAEWLAAQHPEIVAVRLQENLGFAEGVNRGAAIAKGELLVFLNNDAVAGPRFLEELVKSAIGAGLPDCVAARILSWSGDEVEFGGASLNIFGSGSQHSSWHRRFSEAKAGDHLPFACGGAMLIRAEVFGRLGGFDPDYFAYYEDVDLGWRLWLSGHRVVYAPTAEVRHRRHATGERFSATWRHFHWYRNALMTLIKNSDDDLLPNLLPFAFVSFFQRIGALYHAAARASADGDAEHAQFLLGSAVGGADGISWVLDHVEGLWDKRSSVQALRRVPDRTLAEILAIRLDFGAEGDASENARVLRLLPFMDLSALMTPERAQALAMTAASRIADDAVTAIEESRFELVAWHANAKSVGTELHARNLELTQARSDLHARNVESAQLISDLHARNLESAQLRGDLHARNLESAQLRSDLHARSLEVGRLHGELHIRNLEEQALRGQNHSLTLTVEELRGLLHDRELRLDAIVSSVSWRWTAPLRRLVAALSQRPPR